MRANVQGSHDTSICVKSSLTGIVCIQIVGVVLKGLLRVAQEEQLFAGANVQKKRYMRKLMQAPPSSPDDGPPLWESLRHDGVFWLCKRSLSMF